LLAPAATIETSPGFQSSHTPKSVCVPLRTSSQKYKKNR